MKPFIGILSNLKTDENEGPYADYYKVNKVYVDKIKEYGGVAVGIFEVDALDKYDGFLLMGGHRINENHYKVIEYAIKNNKPVLGICNGMQAIVMYSCLYDECLKSNLEPSIANLYKKYDELKAKKIYILKEVANHGSELSKRAIPFNMETITSFKHLVKIEKDSILYDIYKKDEVDVFSIHTYGVYEVPNFLEVLARSEDNVIEAIKYKEKPIIGVQFHTELDDYSPLLEKFVEKCKKIKQ